jgi:hypothetical protein
MFAPLDVLKAFFLAAALRQYSCICTGIAFALAVHDGRHTTACPGALSIRATEVVVFSLLFQSSQIIRLRSLAVNQMDTRGCLQTA